MPEPQSRVWQHSIEGKHCCRRCIPRRTGRDRRPRAPRQARDRGQPGEKCLDAWPMHDVQGVRGEDAVDLADVPGRLRDVDHDRRAQVRRALVEDALAQGRHRLGDLGRLPHDAGHRGREVHRVLAGTAADLEHMRAVGELPAQDLEDRALVAVAGVAVREHDGRIVHSPRALGRPGTLARSAGTLVTSLGDPSGRRAGTARVHPTPSPRGPTRGIDAHGLAAGTRE